ncbi:cytochrome b5 domain-containing protein [Kineobactrum salinum]|uniref:Cytochrome b5 domain-containing protein n=1 Tax=Kineobactrum salinum TaxID=2708301 RepID=A0A6C0TYU9_9GAMM|nr:cytochrome b5-like heme/steroid binding domain-containing protein [Kineobactrum salinum]QIB64549.1 cytochrome b5 domain-containing protein [Kineobactrum salinum]
MKKLCYSAFIAFWSSVGTLVALQALATDPVAAGEGRAAISLDELAAHKNEEDCWMAIEGKVYDVSAYLPKHPTPAAVLLPWCGREATEGMRTKGYGRDHSPVAWGMLEDYLVGALARE